ncbi:uncharacterized protein SOCE26_051680 [Sorangium cellulosum]|uniref:Uncharacterized protein n=1 Tax=Sorangium cellulosum TaxID=56 RepID=A0A2L0EWT0_SORCE|nr:hypothetical protein [Sorangium cellulosum]AUX43715.1 uncharacterized protein SOCE26_051680 [Sorangium cellulosum]
MCTCFASALDATSTGWPCTITPPPLDGEDRGGILAQGGPAIIDRATLDLP